MDVEGYEGFVLDGAPRTLTHVPFVAAEVWPHGIERSGYGRDRFLARVEHQFTSFIDLANPTPARTIDSFGEVFDAMAQGGRFSQFLFANGGVADRQ